MKKIIIIIFLNLNFAIGQNISPYSRFGIGDIASQFSPVFGLQNAPLISNLRQDFINTQNFAANAKTRYTIFSIGSQFTKTFLFDSLNSISNLDDGMFNNIAIAIPIDIKNGFALTSSISPFSKVNDDILITRKVDKYNVEETFIASGGLSILKFGASYSPIENYFVGASFDYIFGERNFNHKSTFSDTSFQSIRTLTKYNEDAVGATFGFIYEPKKELTKLISLNSIGLSFMSPRVLSSEKNTFYERDYFHVDNYFSHFYDTLQTTQKINLPYKAIIGTSFIVSNNLVSFEYSIQDWSKSNFNTMPNIKFLPDENFSFALTTLTKETQSFFDNISFSLGFAHRKSYLSIFENQITENHFSFGVTMPISYTGKMQAGFGYSTRGANSNKLVKENIFTAFVNLTIGELWFVQPSFD